MIVCLKRFTSSLTVGVSILGRCDGGRGAEAHLRVQLSRSAADCGREALEGSQRGTLHELLLLLVMAHTHILHLIYFFSIPHIFVHHSLISLLFIITLFACYMFTLHLLHVCFYPVHIYSPPNFYFIHSSTYCSDIFSIHCFIQTHSSY